MKILENYNLPSLISVVSGLGQGMGYDTSGPPNFSAAGWTGFAAVPNDRGGSIFPQWGNKTFRRSQRTARKPDETDSDYLLL